MKNKRFYNKETIVALDYEMQLNSFANHDKVKGLSANKCEILVKGVVSLLQNIFYFEWTTKIVICS